MWFSVSDGGFPQLILRWSVVVLGFIANSFWLWRLMREDYDEDEVLIFGFLGWLVVVLSGFLWSVWSLGGIVGCTLLAIISWSKRNKWDTWEVLDFVGPVSVGIGGLVCLLWGQWLQTLLLAVLLAVLAFLKKNYRRLSWYSSGRVGFVGLASLTSWMVAWILVAKWQVTGIYWGGLSLEQWCGIWGIIGSLTALYIRSERRTSQDVRQLKKLWPNRKK